MLVLVVYSLIYFASLYLMYQLLVVVMNSYLKIDKDNLMKSLWKGLYYRTVMLSPLTGITLVLMGHLIVGTIIIVVLEVVFIFLYFREKMIYLKNKKG